MYTAFARNAVMGADPEWTRKLFGFAVVPDLVMYLKIDVKHLVPRVLESKGMDYWESGMHLKLGSDIFESFRRYQARILREYERMADEFGFLTVDAQQPIDAIQQELRATIGHYLAGDRLPSRRRPRRQTARASASLRHQGT
jgi:dTMP kinase